MRVRKLKSWGFRAHDAEGDGGMDAGEPAPADGPDEVKRAFTHRPRTRYIAPN
jgi:hypothetical protein